MMQRFTGWRLFRQTLFGCLVAVGSLVFAPFRAEAVENWPEFRGPRGDGHAVGADLPVEFGESQNVSWKTSLPGKAWSSPVIWGSQIWLTNATEDGKRMSVVCIDRDSGQILHDVLLIENEEPRFCHPMNSYGSPTPAIEQGRVYVHFGSYGTACLDTRTAKTLWLRTDLPCNHYRGPGSSPILFQDKLIVHLDGFDEQYVVALDRLTGNTVWKTDRNVDYGTDNGDIKKAFCTPILIEVNGQTQLISPTSKAVMAYDPDTGEEIWRVRYKGFSATARPLFGNGLLYVNTGFSKAELYAIRPDGQGDVTETHVVWARFRGIPSKSSQLLVDDLIYLVHDAGVAACLDAATGETVWQERLGGKYSASPIFAAGRIYFLSHEGTVTVVAHGREYHELAVNEFDEGFMASPAVSGDSLFLRSRTHLYRIDP